MELEASKRKNAELVGQLAELEVAREKNAEVEASLQTAKGTIVHLKNELHASNARFRWFECKLGKADRQLGEANLCASNLEKRIRDLEAGVELYNEAVVQAEDDAIDKRMDAGFKIFKRLMLEAHPDFDMQSLEAHMLKEVILEAMDIVERERAAAKEAVGSDSSRS